jgi:N-methylhydantoinase B
VLAPEATLTTMLERRLVRPWTLLGGSEGLGFRVTVNPGPGEREVGGKETITLRQGDLVLIETCGGGGFGPPEERAPAAVAADRREGYL